MQMKFLVCLHAQLSQAMVKAQLGHLSHYCPCPSIQALRENQFFLSDSATVGSDMPCLAGCYRTFRLTKQATNKLASG